MKRILFLPIIILIAVAVAAGWSLKDRLPGSSGEKMVGEQTEIEEVTESFVLADNGMVVEVDMQPLPSSELDYQMQIGLNPTEGTADLSSFAIKFDIGTDKGMATVDSKWSYNPVLTQDNWAFPISKVEPSEDGPITIKLAGVNMSPEAFNWKGRQVAASIPVKFSEKPGQIQVRVDTDQTKFFTKQAVAVPLAKKVEWTIDLSQE